MKRRFKTKSDLVKAAKRRGFTLPAAKPQPVATPPPGTRA